MSVVVMICFARSGGTVLNQCIGCLSNVVMLSEVNPLGGGGRGPGIVYRSVKEQAKHWYNIDISSDDFIDGILELEHVCLNAGKHLVIRDWSYVNFVPTPVNNFNPPRRLMTLELLEQKCHVVPFAFVRDAIDVWLSRGTAPISDFFKCYLNYTEEIIARHIRIFRYEDFCKNPEEVLQSICTYTGLDYSESFWDYLSFRTVNGDPQIPGGSRGIRQKAIRPLRRKRTRPSVISELNNCIYMVKCNRLLGYPVSYYDVKRESILQKLLSMIIRRISKIKHVKTTHGPGIY